MDYQIYHSYIDKINYSLDENLKLSFIKKLKNILSILDQIYCARKMSNNIEIKYFLISHPVYQYRAFIAKLRNKKKNFLMLGVFGLYKFFNNNSDNDWNFVSNNFFNNISKKKTFKRKSKSYWVQRLKGFSNYRCANVASQNIKKIITGDNYIFLHIFRDSPFRVIDKSRIFIDYFQWFNETMKIIQKSNQKWFIRLHPIHKEWGENQSLIVKKLLKEGGFNRKNIIIDNKLSSNYEIFKKANKIVTYSGTPALEATAFGIKPIIISKTALYSLDNNSAFKPKSLNEYRKLLLSEKKIFNNNKKIQQKAKELIYIQEKILRFDRDIASTETYKNTNNKFKKKNINNLLSNIDKSYVLKNNSNILEKNNTTYSTEFFEYYNDRKLSN